MTTAAAIGYIRLSVPVALNPMEKTDSVVSLKDQEDRIRAYCTMTGLNLKEVVHDKANEILSLNKRIAGNGLVGQLKKHNSTQVVALRLDRLFLDMKDAVEQLLRWRADGITLHLVEFGGQMLNTASSGSQLIWTMLAELGALPLNAGVLLPPVAAADGGQKPAEESGQAALQLVRRWKIARWGL